MSKKTISTKNEYGEMIEFISALQAEEMSEAERLFAQCKELEYRIRQRELIMQEQEKRRNPNITMFSPLDVEDVYEVGVEWKDELAAWKQELSELETKNKAVRERATKLVALEKLFLKLEPLNEKIMREACVDSEEEANSYREYSIKLLETQEMDRNRIARDLHDSTVQSLTGLIHKTELCSKLLDIDLVRAKLELQSMKEVIKNTINDMREVIYDLRPMALNNLGLSSALESLSTHIKKNHELDVFIQVDGDEMEMPSIVRITLYRIVQEACNNIVKHASATRVEIHLIYTESSIEVNVSDNGIGFDINETESVAGNDELYGFGLSTMRERAHLLKGSFSVESSLGKGTKVNVIVPIFRA